ncbi:MAG: flavodoxin family protein, partial [Desulfovibrionaceae bacterium]|nr:flavodoxin family protein [Desulfovibrionaceae bacterium]
QILLLTGSPRCGGNSSLLADAFARGAEQAGHVINRFDTAQMNLKPCIACDSCFSNGAACVFNDEFNQIAPYFESCTSIVFAVPVYWYTFPAQIKAPIDKMWSLIVGKRTLGIRESFLLACAEENNLECFEGLCRAYELIGKHRGWTDRGRILAPNVFNKGDILNTNFLELAEAAGREF